MSYSVDWQRIISAALRPVPKSLSGLLFSNPSYHSKPSASPEASENQGLAPEKPRQTPAFPIADLPGGGLPQANVPEDVDVAAVAQKAVELLKNLRADNLIEEALWRDLFTLTGTTRTFHSNKTVAAAWAETSVEHRPHSFELVPNSGAVMRLGPGISFVQAKFTFRTSGRPIVQGKGIVRVVPDAEGTWRIWLVVTMLDQVPGLPSADIMSPPRLPGSTEPSPRASEESARGVSSGQRPETPISDFGDEADYDCVVIGAGPSGLSIAGHLQALQLRYTVLDRNAELAGNWLNRYACVSIHTSRNYGQLPFKKIWGPEFPYHLRTPHLQKGYEKYVREHDINVMLSTEVERAVYNDASRMWTLQIRTRGNLIYMKARHCVFALGAGGQIPRSPDIANRAAFKGTVMHSADYTSSEPWAGKRAIVIGSANTAHDIANDLLEAGAASVTMVQRGKTPVIPVECWSQVYDPIYTDEAPTSESDNKMMPLPTVLQRTMNMRAIRRYVDANPKIFDDLEKAGFQCERYMDLYHCLLVRFGSHYVDVGVSRKIADGLIKVKSGVPMKDFTETGLRFDDNTTLDADLIVYCTGFEGNMRTAAERIVGRDVASRLDDWWGVDKEGEIRGAWKPIGHPNIWFTGGNLGLARFYARYLALQIKCEVQGFPLKVYDRTP